MEIISSVTDLHRFHANPDPDPACHFAADGDPDPTFHFNTDLDPDPELSFQIKAQYIKKVLE
jgi:hypothetical protein